MLTQLDSPRRPAPDKVMQQENCLRGMALTSAHPPHKQVHLLALLPYPCPFDL